MALINIIVIFLCQFAVVVASPGDVRHLLQPALATVKICRLFSTLRPPQSSLQSWLHLRHIPSRDSHHHHVFIFLLHPLQENTVAAITVPQCKVIGDVSRLSTITTAIQKQNMTAARITLLILFSCLICWVPASLTHLLFCPSGKRPTQNTF